MRYLIFLFILGFCSCKPAAQQQTAVLKDSVDTALFKSFQQLAKKQNLKQYDINERIIKAGMFFLQTPYVAYTLDKDTIENLVINLHELDCSTFVENVVALARITNQDSITANNFVKQLQKIRYRNGKLTDYSSRLHYFSDWIFDNQQKGILTDITKEIGGIPYRKTIDFMGKHPQSYLSLKHNKTMVKKIQLFEKNINNRCRYYIPQSDIKKISRKIKSGDIIGITTNIKGLDISHVGIAVRIGEELFLMNASTKEHKVVIYKTPIWEMVQKNKLQTGIVVARLKSISNNK